MQRALGMDMTTPRSKSQQQIHSPSHAAKPELKPDASTQPAPQTQTPPHAQPPAQAHPAPGPPKQTGPSGPGQKQAKLPPGAVPLPGMAKAPSQPDLSRSSTAHQPQHPRQDQTRSAGSSPSRQPPPPEQTFGKLFGFGASLLNQASTLISETTQPQQQIPKSAPKPGGPPGPGLGADKPSGPQPGQQGPRQQQQAPPDTSKPKPCCPLCKTSLNVGSKAEQPNYNICTQCHSQVCNMCGFNPTPHLVEVRNINISHSTVSPGPQRLPDHNLLRNLLTCLWKVLCHISVEWVFVVAHLWLPGLGVNNRTFCRWCPCAHLASDCLCLHRLLGSSQSAYNASDCATYIASQYSKIVHYCSLSFFNTDTYKRTFLHNIDIWIYNKVATDLCRSVHMKLNVSFSSSSCLSLCFPVRTCCVLLCRGLWCS